MDTGFPYTAVVAAASFALGIYNIVYAHLRNRREPVRADALQRIDSIRSRVRKCTHDVRIHLSWEADRKPHTEILFEITGIQKDIESLCVEVEGGKVPDSLYQWYQSLTGDPFPVEKKSRKVLYNETLIQQRTGDDLDTALMNLRRQVLHNKAIFKKQNSGRRRLSF